MRITPKMRRIRELCAKLFGWLIQSCVMAVPNTSSAMTKFFVGSGCCPLKTRKARPPTNAAKIRNFAYGAYSRLRASSLPCRRRRIFREARPRLISRPRLEKSNMPISLLARPRRRRAMLLIGADYGADQFMPHNIALGKINSRDSRNGFQCLQCLDHSRTFIRWQINLSHVSCNYAFRVWTDPGQQHEHLLRRRVLRLIENDKGMIQSAAPHVSKRSDLDGLPS